MLTAAGAGALFTAIAAGAAWATVVIEARRARRSREPIISAELALIGNDVTMPRSTHLAFVNSGGGPGIRLTYLGVDGGDRVYGNGVGLIRPGADANIGDLGFVVQARTDLMWTCVDADQRRHVWSIDGRHRILGQYPWSATLADDHAVFLKCYPQHRAVIEANRSAAAPDLDHPIA